MASASNPSPPPATTINTLLLASACSGNLKRLNILLTGQGAAGAEELPFDDLLVLPAYAASGTTTESLLKGVTAEGNTALHAVATNGDGDNFLSCADLIYGKAKHDILFVQNKKGDTPLHLAARAGKYKMVLHLIALAKGVVGGTRPAIASDATSRVKALLETKNKLNETVLHEAVRVESDDMVSLLMEDDPELAMIPEQGTSPLYLAVSQDNKIIARTLYRKSGGLLSYSGPNGKNALHAAVVTSSDLTKLLLEWNKELTTGRDENGSTPLHFAAGLQSTCWQLLEANPAALYQLLEANPAALYQSDNDGLFPIHVAASVGACRNVAMFLEKCPGSAGLLDGKGGTFLHVAAEKKKARIVIFVCRNRLLSWILNMQDKDGNTALHLAVQEGILRMVCALLMNLHVQLNLTNEKGHTPLDVSVYKIPPGLYHEESFRVYIRDTLKMIGARHGASRKDYKNSEDKGPEMIRDSKESEITNGSKPSERKRDTSSDESKRIKEASKNLSIGSVLIATVTFGATFALPGGYRADDHLNGGSPTRAGRYSFDAFLIANTLSFICSVTATMGFMFYGSSMIDLWHRKYYLIISVHLMRSSISSLIATFALGMYLVLAPVAPTITTVICCMCPLVVLPSEEEFWVRKYFITKPLRKRKGLAWAIHHVAWVIVKRMVLVFWPIILIFGSAAIMRMHWLASLLHS